MESIEHGIYTPEDIYSYTLEVLRAIERDYALFSEIQNVFPNKRITTEDYVAVTTLTLNEACKTLLEDDVEAITHSSRGMIIGFSVDDAAKLTFSIKQQGIKEPIPVNISEIIGLSPLSKYDAQIIMAS
jgi:hypothetical protein